jgi:hypothetical protein
MDLVNNPYTAGVGFQTPQTPPVQASKMILGLG